MPETVDGAAPSADPKPLSKNQLRKQMRSQRWEEGREARKEKRRAKKEQKREQRRLAAEAGLTKRVETPTGEPSTSKRRRVDLSAVTPPDSTVVIDCSFDDLMLEKEISSLSRQIETVYAVNRRSSKPFNVGVTSFGGRLRTRFETLLESRARWQLCTFYDEDYTKLFPRERLVYLSSESSTVLSTLEPGDVYIIGGLVDHNRHKGLCFQRAQELGIRTAQLPIGEHLRMASRKVLAVNHVFEILSKVREHGDWVQALASTIPLRKQFQVLGASATSSDAGDGDNHSDDDGKAESEGRSSSSSSDSTPAPPDA